ncbi:MAG TPA: BON domain-containing protein [Kiritimatiellia bacterium]|nr:BON domain-containing protein [Kiritimatiellia bacterium]HMO98089.1 BON domain-containing protein [Kiritimatiellia bacterium]HMP96332.1 BON domain-containing protein [Kiritimatiellia bacterium]
MKCRLVYLLILLLPVIGAIGCATLERSTDLSGDQALVVEARRRLANDPMTSDLRLGIQADDGIVTLTGRLNHPSQGPQAVGIVRGISGVRGVIDQTLRF